MSIAADIKNAITEAFATRGQVDTSAIASQLATANTRIAELVSESAAFTKKQLEMEGRCTAFTAQVAGLTVDLATTRTALTAAQATIADPKGEIETRASVIAREIVASQGGKPPLTVVGQENPGAPTKPDFSKLTGLEKVIAIEKFESAQKALNAR